MLGFIRIASDAKASAAIAQASEYFELPSHKPNVVDLITVALVRAACPVVAIGLPFMRTEPIPDVITPPAPFASPTRCIPGMLSY
jgi:hypothetical protein